MESVLGQLIVALISGGVGGNLRERCSRSSAWDRWAIPSSALLAAD